MKTDATSPGASAATAADQQDDNNTALDTNAESGDHPVKERAHPLAQREAALEKFEQWRREQQPDAEVQGSLGANAASDETADATGDETQQAEEPPAAAAKDPLEDFIVKDEAGQAFFKTIVDGKERLVPLDRARAQLQKHEAAELRLQTASERAKALEAREAELARREQAAQQARTPSTQDASGEDEALEREASELVTSLIEDDEAEAAKKLAAALKKARNSGSQVDHKALVDEVAAAVAARQAKAAEDAALLEGLNAYLKEYGETVDADPALRAWHAAKVDELVQANPTWSPGQAMLEAGKLAEKFAGIERGSPTTDSTQAAPASDPRQQRKQALQPVPQSRSAVSGVKQPQTPDSSPQSVLDEMRRARGQPVPRSRQVG